MRIGAIGDHGGDWPGATVAGPRIQDAELVAFRVGHDLPRHLALADVCWHRAQGEQPFHLGGLV